MTKEEVLLSRFQNMDALELAQFIQDELDQIRARENIPIQPRDNKYRIDVAGCAVIFDMTDYEKFLLDCVLMGKETAERWFLEDYTDGAAV